MKIQGKTAPQLTHSESKDQTCQHRHHPGQRPQHPRRRDVHGLAIHENRAAVEGEGRSFSTTRLSHRRRRDRPAWRSASVVPGPLQVIVLLSGDTRSLLPSFDCRRWLCGVRSSLFYFCARSLAARHLAEHGILRIVLRAQCSGVEGPGRGHGSLVCARERTGRLLFCDQRCHLAREHHYR